MPSTSVTGQRHPDQASHRVRARARLAAVAGGVALVLMQLPAQAAAAEHVHGTWQTLVPAALTSFTPSEEDPTTGTFTAVGSTEWSGTWTGVTTYTVSGTINLVTNESSGVLQETFTGTTSAAAAGQVGTLSLTERFTLDAAGVLQIRCRIVDGTGPFAGSRGHVDFEGQMLNILEGHGTYSGTWRHA